MKIKHMCFIKHLGTTTALVFLWGRAIDTLVLDFWWGMSWVSRPGWIPGMWTSSCWCIGFLRFTSGATPADLLVASIAVDGWWWTFKNNRLFNDLIWLHLISHLAWTANFGANVKNSSDRIIWTVIMLRHHFLNELSGILNFSLFRQKWYATSQIQILEICFIRSSKCTKSIKLYPKIYFLKISSGLFVFRMICKKVVVVFIYMI